MGRDPENLVLKFVSISNTQCYEMGQELALETMSPEFIIIMKKAVNKLNIYSNTIHGCLPFLIFSVIFKIFCKLTEKLLQIK